MTAVVAREDAGITLSAFLKRRLGLSSASVRRLRYREGGITRNSLPVPVKGTLLAAGDVIELDVSDREDEGEGGCVSGLIPADLPLKIIYEDALITVCDKPAGMPAHPVRRHLDDTLGNALAYRAEQRGERPFVFRPVMRLDSDTSGVATVARDFVTAGRMSDALTRGLVKKTYYAVCEGIPSPACGTVDAPLARSDGRGDEDDGSGQPFVCDEGQPVGFAEGQPFGFAEGNASGSAEGNASGSAEGNASGSARDIASDSAKGIASGSSGGQSSGGAGARSSDEPGFRSSGSAEGQPFGFAEGNASGFAEGNASGGRGSVMGRARQGRPFGAPPLSRAYVPLPDRSGRGRADDSIIDIPDAPRGTDGIASFPSGAAAPGDPAAAASAKWRIAGELFNTYIVVEEGDALTLFDKHAAHERLNFEKMRARLRGAVRNTSLLALPIEIDLGTAGADAVERNREEIEKIGFDFTRGERGRILVGGVPEELDRSEVPPLFERFAEALTEGAGDVSLIGDDAFEKALYQASCKASVKGGRVYPPGYAEYLVGELMRRPDITYCPHGRPIAVRIRKADLDRRFGRN